MAIKSITSANSILLIGVTGLFPIPQQMQGFDQEDMYAIEGVETKEVKIGVDGQLAAGQIPAIKKMDVQLMANSSSNSFFEAWYAAEQAANDVYFAFGTIVQPALGFAYVLTNGVLFNYAPISDAKKVQQARKFQIQWQSIVGAPI